MSRSHLKKKKKKKTAAVGAFVFHKHILFGHIFFKSYGSLIQLSVFNPFPNNKFRNFRLKELADNDFKFYKNGGKFYRRVENTVQAISLLPAVLSKDL